MTDIRDSRVLITGSGHGLGRELAKGFCQEGAEVIVTDVDAQRVHDTVTQLRKADFSAFGYKLDVADIENVQDVHRQIREEHGPIDVLVNNAGIVAGGVFENIPLDRHHATFKVNSLGTINVTHAFLTELIGRPQSHIVNIASAAAMLPLPFAATYAASKWALLGFSESLREELRLTGQDHVHITSVCPSYIATGMFTGVTTPTLVPMLTAWELTNEVVSAVKSNREVVRTPWPVRFLPFLQGLLPRRVQRFLGDRLGIFGSMQTWGDLTSPSMLAKAPPVNSTLTTSDSRSASLSQ